METMYERIKRMSENEMEAFIYWVYMNGNKDGFKGYCDSPSKCSYFGGYMLTQEREIIMPNDSVSDLLSAID